MSWTTPAAPWSARSAPGRRSSTVLLGALVAGVLALLMLLSSALAGGAVAATRSDATDDLSRLLGRPVTGLPQELELTGAPQRSGRDVVLTTQVVGVPDPDGAPQVFVAGPSGELTAFTGTAEVTGTADAPVRTAVLLVDTSGSMGPQGTLAAGRAAQVYADTVGASVKVGLVAFADRPTVLTPPTTDRAALAAGIRNLTPQGETALYDGVVTAARLAGRGGNVVLLSDGGDTVSRAGLAQAVAAVTGAGVRVDVVAFKTAETAQEPLAKLAAAGTGQVVRAADAAQLGEAFAAAAAAVPLDITITITTPATRTGAEQVRVALLVGGKVYLGTVDLPAAPVVAEVAPAPRGELVAPVAGSWPPPWLIAGLFFVVLAALAAAVLWPPDPVIEDRRRRRTALQAYQVANPYRTDDLPETTVGSAATGVLQISERMVAAGGRGSAIALRLDRAGLRLLPHEWVVLRACIVLAAAASVFLVVSPRWLGLPLGAALGWLGTEAWLRWRQTRRCRAFADQLPDTLQVVASSLRSGFSLPQALAAAAEGSADPMASELGRALAAARIGAELEDELEQVAVRMRSEDWRLAVMAIRIQRSVGGSLAEVLTTTAATLRERAALARQVRALSAEGRLSAYVLLGLPVGVGAFLLLFRRGYVEPLWTTTPGLAMLAAAALGMVVGTWWMFKVAKVEV